MPSFVLFALRHWKLVLSGIAVVSLAVTAGYYRIDRNHWRAVAHGLRIDLDRVKIATEIADKRAREAKAAAEAEYRRKAEETDREYAEDLADARARADRYARLNRVPASARGASSGPATPAEGNGPEGADGPGEDAVVLSRPDFDILTENTERLKAAREWACGLEGADCPQ